MAIALITLILASCQNEDLYDGLCNVRFKAYVQDEVSVTRAAEGYTEIARSNTSAFDAALFVSFGATHKEYEMKWNGSNALSTNARLETGNYNFYGFAPKIEGVTASFDDSDKKLTISSIPALDDKDMMVIKPCSVTVTSNEIGGNKTVNLEMDHLMAKITPYFYLNSEYNKLRNIRIKTVKLFFDSAPTYDAAIGYNESGYTTTWLGGSSAKRSVTIYNNTTLPVDLTTQKGEQAYGHCYIVPSQSTSNLKMKVTYDVYDKSGSLTRKDETAVNVIKKLPTNLSVGYNYKLNIQIVPSYLYVLSDNDEASLVIPN